MKRRQARRMVILEVDHLMKEYCEGCLLYRHNKEVGGRLYAHRFCISICTVGEQIKELGKVLSGQKSRLT